MLDVAAYDETENLEHGIAVRIRAIPESDKRKLSETFRNPEPESIYTRFFHQKRELTDIELKSATEVDLDSVVALVVTIERMTSLKPGHRPPQVLFPAPRA